MKENENEIEIEMKNKRRRTISYAWVLNVITKLSSRKNKKKIMAFSIHQRREPSQTMMTNVAHTHTHMHSNLNQISIETND